MDPTCRNCGGYPCDCGKAIGVPIKTSDGYMIRNGSDFSLKKWVPEREPTEEEKKQAKDARKLEVARRQEEEALSFENGTCNNEIATTYLSKAVQNGDIEMAAKALLLGADKQEVTFSLVRCSFLHKAIRKVNFEMCKLLIEANADVNAKGERSATKASEFTPLIDAVRTGDEQIVRLLLENKALVHLTDNVGRTAAQQPDLSPSMLHILGCSYKSD